MTKDDFIPLAETDEKNDIKINITKVWKFCDKKEDTFIKVFSELELHEKLHQMLFKINNKTPIGEEKAIYLLCGEKWSKDKQKFYSKYYGDE